MSYNYLGRCAICHNGLDYCTCGAPQSNERLALQLASDRKALLVRLRETVHALSGRYHKFFQRKHQRFDFERKRLYGFDGWFLQWQTRLEPEQPESYENQQTSVGIVVCGRDNHAPDKG